MSNDEKIARYEEALHRIAEADYRSYATARVIARVALCYEPSRSIDKRITDMNGVDSGDAP